MVDQGGKEEVGNGIYGDYADVFEEVVRYLNDPRRGVKVNLETPYTPGPKSL